jgi:hypothetical protein
MKPSMRIRIYLFLIVFALLGMIINTFYGNPISKSIAIIHMQNFIKKNFNDRNLKMRFLGYNIEDTTYDAEIIDEKTEIKYLIKADELGVKFQDLIYNYDYNKRVLKYPSIVFFFSIGAIGVILSTGYFLRKRMSQT